MAAPVQDRPGGGPAGAPAVAREPGLRGAWRRYRAPVVEVLVVFAFYQAYAETRRLVVARRGPAEAHAHSLRHLEDRLGFGVEHGVNHWLTSVHPLAVVCAYYYATLHFVVTAWVLVWLWRRRRPAYSRLRTPLVVISVLALVLFTVYPLAPPRLVAATHTVDTVVAVHTWGSLATSAASKDANPYAAMPSLHIAWSTWVAVVLVTQARHRLTRVLGALYPLATTFVVVATANHWVLDAVAGAALTAACLLACALVWGFAPRFTETTPVAAPAAGPPARAAGAGPPSEP